MYSKKSGTHPFAADNSLTSSGVGIYYIYTHISKKKLNGVLVYYIKSYIQFYMLVLYKYNIVKCLFNTLTDSRPILQLYYYVNS